MSRSKLDQKNDKIKSPDSNKQKDTKSQNECENEVSSTGKHRKCHGIRVVHGRIYDSENGRTCHQCRQKTKDLAAECRNHRNNKPCTIKYCHKCLLNRYGERAEEVATLQDWSCPKCKGICNCSFCMKKRGHQPTGILVHTAKANGYSSVSEMLKINGPEFNHEKPVKDTLSTPRKRAASETECLIIVPKKQGKENTFDGKIESSLQSLPSVPKRADKMYKKVKLEESRKSHNDSSIDHVDGNASLARGTRKMQERQKEKHRNRDSVSLLNDVNSPGSEKKPKMIMREELNSMNEGNFVKSCLLGSTHKQDDKKLKQLEDEKSDGIHGGYKNVLRRDTSPRRSPVSNGTLNREANLKDGVNAQKMKLWKTKVFPENSMEPFRVENKKEKAVNNTCKMAEESWDINKNYQRFQNEDVHADILPQGTAFTVVGGIKLQPEDVGKALQFLEFCAVFGKILDVKKGQPECVLRDMINGRSSRQGKYSSLVQFQIHLISVIREERELGSSELSPTYGKSSWVHALKECISESERISKSQTLGHLDKGANGYENLNSSEKLMILNILCDEVLGTEKIRSWIDDQISKHIENAKEQKEKVLAAKDKEKRLKQKMQDEIARAIIERNGAPLSISEHDALISQIKNEAVQAHVALMESKGMLVKNQTSDAVRTEPIYLGSNGRLYWRLKCFSNKSDVLGQEVGTGRASPYDERWFSLDDEEKEVIEKHIRLFKGKKANNSKKVLVPQPSQNSVTCP